MQLNYALIAKCHEARTRQEEAEAADFQDGDDYLAGGTS